MNQSRYPTPGSPIRAAAKLDALLMLSRSLGGSRPFGITSETLELLLAATGYTRGAAYAIQGGELQLVAHRGLPSPLRERVERLPITGPAWFLAQRAVQERALVGAGDVSTAYDGGLAAATFAAAGWTLAVACPIAAGRELHGVMMLASPVTRELDEPSRAVLEIACQLLAHRLPRGPEEPRSEGGGRVQVAALGVLACGFMSELDGQLVSLERDLARQEQLVRRLKASEPEGPALEIGALTASSTAALRQAREICERLFSTFQGALAGRSRESARPSPGEPPSKGSVSPPTSRSRAAPSVRAPATPARAEAHDRRNAPTEPEPHTIRSAASAGRRADEDPPTPVTHGTLGDGRVTTWGQHAAPGSARRG